MQELTEEKVQEVQDFIRNKFGLASNQPINIYIHECPEETLGKAKGKISRDPDGVTYALGPKFAIHFFEEIDG